MLSSVVLVDSYFDQKYFRYKAISIFDQTNKKTQGRPHHDMFKKTRIDQHC
jgi:hypothetical protein